MVEHRFPMSSRGEDPSPTDLDRDGRPDELWPADVDGKRLLGVRTAWKDQGEDRGSRGERVEVSMDDGHLRIGALLFEQLDQIDFTGPFEVLGRLPGSSFTTYAKDPEPVRDVLGLRLTPDATFSEAPQLDVLHIPGGPRDRRRDGGRGDAELGPPAGGRGAVRALGVHRRPDLRGGGPDPGATGHDALGGSPPAALLRCGSGRRTGRGRRDDVLRRGCHRRHRRSLAVGRRAAG